MQFLGFGSKRPTLSIIYLLFLIYVLFLIQLLCLIYLPSLISVCARRRERPSHGPTLPLRYTAHIVAGPVLGDFWRPLRGASN